MSYSNTSEKLFSDFLGGQGGGQLLLLQKLAEFELEYIVLIDRGTGMCADVRQMLEAPGDPAGVTLHDYDLLIHERLREKCSDPNPSAVMHSLSLHSVCNALDEGPIYHVYYMVTEEDNHQLHKKASFFGLSDDNRLICGSFKDWSQAVEAEEIRTENLAQALAQTRANLDANNAFLTLINRDIRTPLHSILALTRLANSEVHDVSVMEGYLHKISMSGSYMNETIDDIRDLIRVTGMPIELHPEITYLPVFFSAILQNAKKKAEDRNLSFGFDYTELANETILADRIALRQILNKLLANVVNYALPGASVSLQIKETEPVNSLFGLVLTAVCRGIDMAPERLDILEKPYEEVLHLLRSNLSTMDIDLIILKAYVTAMDGSISVQTRKGIDTTVTIHLPFPASEGQSSYDEPIQLSEIPDFHGFHTLLVDDNPINLEVAVKLLEQTGLQVSTAGNGAEACEMFQSGRCNPDLILMDIHMPVMDGLEAARRIRASSRADAATVPIIAMTVNALPSDIDDSLQAGMDAHLIKPFSPRELYEVLSRFLKH